MNTELSMEKRRKTRNLLIVQTIGAVLGVILAVDQIDDGIGDFMQAIIGVPFILAFSLRLAVLVYRFVRIKFGRKLFDDAGVCIAVVPRTVLGVIAGFLTVYLTLLAIIGIGSSFNRLLIVAVAAVIAAEVFFLIRDINSLRSTKTETDSI